MNSPQFRAKVERNYYPSFKEKCLAKRKKSEEPSQNTNVMPSPRKRRKTETMPYLLSRSVFQEGPSLMLGCGQKKDESNSASVDMKDDRVNFFGGISPLAIQEQFFRFELCFNCLTRKEGLMICSSCEKAVYCNTKCQHSDWLFHQKNCLEFEIQMSTKEILLTHFDNATKKATTISDGEVVILPSRSFSQEKKKRVRLEPQNVQKVKLVKQMAHNGELREKRDHKEKEKASKAKEKGEAPIKLAKLKEKQESEKRVKESKIMKGEMEKDRDKKELNTVNNIVKNTPPSKNNMKITSFEITFPKTFAYSKETMGFLEAAKRFEETINK